MRYETGNWGDLNADSIWKRSHKGTTLIVLHTLFQHMRVLRILQFGMMIIREGATFAKKVRNGMRWPDPPPGTPGPIPPQNKWITTLVRSNWRYLEETALRGICRAAQRALNTRWDHECDRRQAAQLQILRAIRIRLGRRIDQWRLKLEQLRTAVEQGSWFWTTTEQ